MLVDITSTIGKGIVYIKVDKNKTSFNSNIYWNFFNICSNENIKFDRNSIINLLQTDENTIMKILENLVPKIGEVFFNKFKQKKEYDLDDFCKIMVEYFYDYDLGIIPSFLKRDFEFSDIQKIKEPKKVSKEIKVYNQYDLKEDILKVLEQEQNPTDFDVIILEGLEHFKYENIKFNNKIVLNKSFKFINNIKNIYFKNPNVIKNFIKFKNPSLRLKTSEKRMIMKALNKISHLDFTRDEMRANKGFWEKISKSIIPQAKKWKSYRGSQILFKQLSNNTLNSTGQQLFNLLNKNEKISFIGKEGILARNLINIYEKVKYFKEYETEFLNGNIKNKTLLELFLTIQNRSNNDKRFIKLQDNEFKIIDNNKLSNKTQFHLSSLVIEKLKKNLKDLNIDINYKKVYLDKELLNIGIPLDIKESFISDEYLPRGSRIKLPEKCRVFIAWKTKGNNEGRIDVDLGALLINDKNFDVVDFTRYGSDKIGVVHSGDWTSCRRFDPKDGIITSEFIDLDFSKISKEWDILGADVINYNNWSYEDFDCYMGITDIPDKEIISKNSKIPLISLNNAKFLFKLTSNNDSCIPFTIDLKSRELIIIGKYQNENKFSSSAVMLDNFKFWHNYFKNSLNLYQFFNLLLDVKNIERVENIDDAELIIDSKFAKEFNDILIEILN